MPDADEHLLHNSVRIAPTGLKLSRYSDLTLVASLGNVSKRDKQYAERFITGSAKWYHMPASTADKKISRNVMRELRCCAIAVYNAASAERRIEYLYDVKSVQLVKRYMLTAEQAGIIDSDNQNDYWLYELGASHRLSTIMQFPSGRRFRFRLTGASDLLNAQSWNDLPDRYISFTENNDTAL